jgi:hypothetical protein
MISRFRIVAAPTIAIAALLALTAPANADPDPSNPGAGSPGVLSGDVIQAPIQIPINLCGNTIDIVGLLNPTFGNTCINA